MSDSSLPIWCCPGYCLIGHPTEIAHLWVHKTEYCIKHCPECAVGPGAFGSMQVLVDSRPFTLGVLCDRDSGDHGLFLGSRGRNETPPRWNKQVPGWGSRSGVQLIR